MSAWDFQSQASGQKIPLPTSSFRLPPFMKCPVCGARYRSQPASGTVLSCRRCGSDLTALIQVHDQAVWWYRQACEAFEAEDYPTAQTAVQAAIALHGSQYAEFYLLAGKVWAMQGEWSQAWQAWRQAAALEPKSEAVQALLQQMSLLRAT